MSERPVGEYRPYALRLLLITQALLWLAACASPALKPGEVFPHGKPPYQEKTYRLDTTATPLEAQILNYDPTKEFDSGAARELLMTLLALGSENNSIRGEDDQGNVLEVAAEPRRVNEYYLYATTEAERPVSFTEGLEKDDISPGITWAGDDSRTSASSIVTDSEDPRGQNLDDLFLVEACQGLLRFRFVRNEYDIVTYPPSTLGIYHRLRANEFGCNMLRVAKSEHSKLDSLLPIAIKAQTTNHTRLTFTMPHSVQDRFKNFSPIFRNARSALGSK